MKFGPGWRRKDGGGQPTRSPSTFPRTRTTLKRYIAYALFALAGFLLGWWSVRTTPADVTTSLLSPNEKMRAVLVEHPLSFIDRNFRVYLEKTENRGALSSELFRSPIKGGQSDRSGFSGPATTQGFCCSEGTSLSSRKRITEWGKPLLAIRCAIRQNLVQRKPARPLSTLR